jgi:hypothetical protein
MYHTSCTLARLTVGAAALALCATAGAAQLNVTVKVENLAPTNSISFAPLHLGFNNGSFDAFNNGETATSPIVSVAEGGSGSAWQPAFAAADPSATRGTIGGLLQPGERRSSSFLVDTMLNPFFTFAAMVVPSNDFFIGNDSPTRFRLFDAAGNLLIGSIGQKARDIWDAGAFAGTRGAGTPPHRRTILATSTLPGRRARMMMRSAIRDSRRRRYGT